MNSYVYAKTPQMRVDVWPDFDEWASTVVAAVKARKSRFGASAGGAPAQSRIGLRRWGASRVVTKIAD
jgi:hypothetical protein